MMTKFKGNKVLALLCVLVMVVSLLPTVALAEPTAEGVPGGVTVKLFVVGDLSPEENGGTVDYEFNLKLLDGDDNPIERNVKYQKTGGGVFLQAVPTDGYVFSLKKDESISFSEIAAGTKVKIEETTAGDFTTGAQVGLEEEHDTNSYVYTIQGGYTRSVIFTNNYGDKTGSLTVSKTVSGGGADTAKEFSFKAKVSYGDSLLDGTYGGMVFKDGEATFTLTNGQSIKATGLPVGYSYYVQETDSDGYTVTAKQDGTAWNEGAALGKESSVEGIIESDNLDAVVEFTNYKAGSSSATSYTYPLKLSKQVSGLAAVPDDYAVTLNIVNNYGSVVRTLTLGANESKTIYLPYGRYTISETAPEVDGYKLVSQEFSDDAFFLTSSGKSISITNTYAELTDEGTEPGDAGNIDDSDNTQTLRPSKDSIDSTEAADDAYDTAVSDDTAAADENVPKTGEASHLAFWIVIAISSLIGMAALTFGRKRFITRNR